MPFQYGLSANLYSRLHIFLSVGTTNCCSQRYHLRRETRSYTFRDLPGIRHQVPYRQKSNWVTVEAITGVNFPSVYMLYFEKKQPWHKTRPSNWLWFTLLIVRQKHCGHFSQTLSRSVFTNFRHCCAPFLLNDILVSGHSDLFTSNHPLSLAVCSPQFLKFFKQT